jgi:hypothetical protein
MEAWMRAQRTCMRMLMLVLLMATPLAESATNMKDAGVLNLLRKGQPEDVIMHPYPYIVIKDAWPKPLYDRLSKEFPSIKNIVSGPGIKGAGVGSLRQTGARWIANSRRREPCVHVDSLAPCMRLHALTLPKPSERCRWSKLR